MDAEVNLLQQRFNKIELEKLQKRSFTLRNRRKGMNEEDKRNKSIKIDQEIKSTFDREISSNKAFKESNSGLSLSAFYKKNKIYDEVNAPGNRREK